MVKLNKKKSKTKQAPVKQLTRKEIRKQKAEEKKEHKRLFFSSKTDGKKLVSEAKQQQQQIKDGKGKKDKKKKPKITINPEDIPIEQLLSGEVNSDNDESVDSDFSDEEVDALLPESLKLQMISIAKKEPPVRKPKQIEPPRPHAEETHRRELMRQKDLENASKKRRIKQLKIENEEEDKMIAKLEKKLGLNKTKNKNRLVRKMFNDGLDFALELCLDDEEEKEKQALKEKRKDEMKKQQKEPSWSDEEQDEERFNAIFGSGEESEDSETGNLAGEEQDEFDDDSNIGEEEGDMNDGDFGEEQESDNEQEKEEEDECKWMVYISNGQFLLQFIKAT